MIKFDKSQRSSFSYWFWHWLAFNATALKLNAWRPKYLLHDIEKPWLKLWYRNDYSKLQEKHRHSNNHHLQYGLKHGFDKIDYTAMMIDWECSHLTKKACPRNARQELERILEQKKNDERYSEKDLEYIKKRCEGALHFLGL